MWILDTNVLSELMRPRPEPAVVAWLDTQAPESLWTTRVTVFEVRFGLALMPEGRRRQALHEAFELLLAEDLAGRVLDFDSPAAIEAAGLAAQRQQSGRPVDWRDTQIAGIARARRGALVTRNLRHFEDAGVRCLDPWA